MVRAVDFPLGTWFHYQGLRLSLRSGDPYMAAQALGREATIGVPFRGQSADRIERLTALALGTAARVARPDRRAEAEAVIGMFRATAYFLAGEFARALRPGRAGHRGPGPVRRRERGLSGGHPPPVRGGGPALPG